ncbi:Hypothetical predicted protein [Octopus vulgaris]|uniref:SCAN domain-containing protein 3-like n=1 Tax=Octopus vulgaris TaxID=6645 RepID=A0AA36BI75_OCTVU|nr:Hypothetical predicted protein [Octopus vulgaris]
MREIYHLQSYKGKELQDGAPAMTGCLKGFVPIAQKQNPNINHTHCFIHREALVAKNLGPELKSALDMVVKIHQVEAI